MAHLGLGLGGAGLGISAGLGYGSLSPLSPVVRCHGGPPPPKVKNESPAAKMIISAGVAFVFELTIGHYFEVLKIQKQTSELSYAGITRVMIKQKGLAGLGQAPQSALSGMGLSPTSRGSYSSGDSPISPQHRLRSTKQKAGVRMRPDRSMNAERDRGSFQRSSLKVTFENKQPRVVTYNVGAAPQQKEG